MSDLNTIAHGINPETGEYLTPEERKQLFKKGRMKSNINVESFRSGVASGKKSSGSGGGGKLVKFYSRAQKTAGELVKAETQSITDPNVRSKGDEEVKSAFSDVENLFKKVVTIKNDKKRLHKKYLETLAKSQKRKSTKPKKSDEDLSLPRKGRSMLTAASANIFGMFGDILQFAVLSWIGDPKNKKTVRVFVDIFNNVVKFFDWFVTGVIDNLLSGFAELVGGDSLLEKLGGFFKLIAGIFGLRWLLNPLKIVKDLRSATKILGKFVKIFRGIFKLGDSALKKTFSGTLKLIGKSFRVALSRTIQRFFIKLFGGAFTKMLKPLAKQAAKGAGKVVRRVPFIGPLLGIAIDLAFGEPIDKALVRAAGGVLGSALGATLAGVLGGILGTVVPVIGNLLLGSAAATAGGVVGSFIGEWIAGTLYDGTKKLFGGGDDSKEPPQLSTGGVVTGPKEGYLAVLHGTEAVIPVSQIPEVLNEPFKALGSGLLGSMFAVVNSTGSSGTFVRPIMVSMLAPQIKEFGVKTLSSESSGVGKTEGSGENIANTIKRERKKQDLEKMFGKDLLEDLGKTLMVGGGSLFGEMFGRPAQASTGGGGGGDMGASGGDYPPDTSSSFGGDISGSGISKAVKIAKRLQKDMGISAAAAAGIVGNLMLESGLQPDNVENGKGFKDGAINNIPPGTQRVGYGWGQWTNDRLEKFRKFLKARGADGRPATDEDNYAYLLHELRTSEPIKGHWKGWQGRNIPEDDPAKAATWFMMNWERPGIPHQDKRQKYAKSIFAQMKSGGSDQMSPPTPSTAAVASSPPPSTPPQQSSSSPRQTSSASFIPSKPPSSSGMVQMSNIFSMDRNIQSRSQSSPTVIANIGGSSNSLYQHTNLNLNSTSLSDTLVLNRI